MVNVTAPWLDRCYSHRGWNGQNVPKPIPAQLHLLHLSEISQEHKAAALHDSVMGDKMFWM